jgi:hypothetical protein
MSKRRAEWHEMPCPSSASSVRTYMDVCEAFLLATHTDANVVAKHASWSQPRVRRTVSERGKVIGLFDDELHMIGNAPCYVCGDSVVCANSGEQAICANPFSRAQFMIACRACIRALRE